MAVSGAAGVCDVESTGEAEQADARLAGQARRAERDRFLQTVPVFAASARRPRSTRHPYGRPPAPHGFHIRPLLD
jgi:hypothetical protein